MTASSRSRRREVRVSVIGGFVNAFRLKPEATQ